MQKKYRPNVAMLILNAKGQILACERSDIPGAWQIPQGGIDPGEIPEQAMWRELEEEIGISKEQARILGKLPNPILYDWPEHLYSRGFHGQEQHYFLLRLDENTKITLDTEHAEFASTRWLTKNEFLSLVEGFKKEAYKRAIGEFEKLLPGLIN